jgi:hypothetical protein
VSPAEEASGLGAVEQALGAGELAADRDAGIVVAAEVTGRGVHDGLGCDHVKHLVAGEVGGEREQAGAGGGAVAA